MELDLKQLKEQKDQVEDIISKILFPLLITSKDTRKVVYANPYAQKVYEIPLDQLVGTSIDTFYTQENQREKILDSINEEGLIENLEMSFKTTKGKTFYGLLSLIDITFKDEECYLGMVTDITVQKEQQLELERLNKELNEYKDHLEEKVNEEINKRKASELILAHKSKLASMGEMIDAIAHQWKQPLNSINLLVQMLSHDFEDNTLTKDRMDKFLERFNKQKNHMLSTLNEFRGFFRPNKDIRNFNITKAINSVLILLKDELLTNRIEVNIDTKEPFEISGNENEFKHVILNIINNSKDAFIENDIDKRIINIKIYTNKYHNHIELMDNAGGIPDYIIDDIFKANVSSKMEEKGTGIGLYMSKQILEKIHGKIEAKNIENGAKILIKIPKGI